MATAKIVPWVPADRSITGVEVMPICGVTWLQPRVSLVVSPEPISETIHRRSPDIRIKGVYRVVFGGNEHNIVAGTGHRQSRQIQRLRIHLAVHLQIAQQPEAGHIDIGRRQDRLGGVLARAHAGRTCRSPRQCRRWGWAWWELVGVVGAVGAVAPVDPDAAGPEEPAAPPQRAQGSQDGEGNRVRADRLEALPARTRRVIIFGYRVM